MTRIFSISNSPFLIISRRSLSTTSLKLGPNVEVRTRFAPSPTGYIHLGGLRTALYNYIFARQHEGKFILRIEDTDQTRIVPGSAEAIEDQLNLFGIRPDESPKIGGTYGPYYQSERLDLYKQRAKELLASGKAYKCFCSPLRLDLLRKSQMKNGERPRYDGRCRNLSPEEVEEKSKMSNGTYAIRFAMESKLTSFDDMVFGEIQNDYAKTPDSDPIIIKSDGYPTYHFANVVDDHAMKISHVMRGKEWITSTCKHIQIYNAFGWKAPKFAHFPLIKMNDGTKMSKRNNQSQLSHWLDTGYRTKAILNALTNVGGGVPKEKQDSMDLWNLETHFNNFHIDHLSCNDGEIDVNRMNIYNSKDLRETWENNPSEILQEFKALLKTNQIKSDVNDEALKKMLNQYLNGRIVTLNELLSAGNTFIWGHPDLDFSLEAYRDKGLDLKKIVENVITIVEECGIDRTLLDPKLKAMAAAQGIDWSLMMRTIRKLLTNSDVGLPVYEIFNCLGKERLLEYLNRGLKYVS